MRIATWNVNSVRTRLEQVLCWLEQTKPDLLCLQETKVDDPLFPMQAFENAGWQVSIHGQKSYNGVALVSREPLEDVRCGFVGELPDDAEAASLGEQKRVISGLLDGVRVLNLYVPNGSSLSSEKYPYKLSWLGCLKRYLDTQAVPTPEFDGPRDWDTFARSSYQRRVYRGGTGLKRVLFQSVGEAPQACGDGFGESHSKTTLLRASGLEPLPTMDWLINPPVAFLDVDRDGGLEALIYDIDDRDSYSLLSVSGETIATNARPFYGCRC